MKQQTTVKQDFVHSYFKILSEVISKANSFPSHLKINEPFTFDVESWEILENFKKEIISL